ncbi:MAG TPA: kynureninase [Burkholderiales bacterium]|nr:kynureninase [Burkholderiales bacterium]
MIGSADAALARTPRFEAEAEQAQALDRQWAAHSRRDLFHIPHGPAGTPVIYFCGHSLGLQPKSAASAVAEVLDDWRELAVHGHFDARNPWYSYHEMFRETGARLVGARPGEVVMMNSLTTNLHLMMASFYRPKPERYKILIEDSAFPSDAYAVQSQAAYHGYDPEQSIIVARPREGEATLRLEDIEALLDARGREIALVLLGGVNYFTGQAFAIQRITERAHRQGCVVGFDLAHAAGNLVLELHDWEVDFAVWCSYKYLNAGPGAVAGCFVHARHGNDPSIPRLAGWWGNDPRTRFHMHAAATFQPRPGADGWQLSNPPILALAPLRASLEIFDAVGMERLRARSEMLTGYMEFLLGTVVGDGLEILTPPAAQERGCQLSIRVRDGAAQLVAALEQAGVVCDFREPDVLRVAPVPLYNTCEEIWRFSEIVRTSLGNRS